jgi:uncharacterized C2H2 Zn-finger protein
MNNADLLTLRAGGDFSAFSSKVGEEYVRRIAWYFHRKASRFPSAVDLADYEQIARIALWTAVGEYRWRCPACPRRSRDAETFARHCRQRHGRKLKPRSSLFWWVHGRVGRSLYREMRRAARRAKFTAPELFDFVEPAVGPKQEQAAELALLLERAKKELDDKGREILEQLALGGRKGRPKIRAFLEGRVA